MLILKPISHRAKYIRNQNLMKLLLENVMFDKERAQAWTNIHKGNKRIKDVKNMIHSTFGDS
jgi:hypothetical protein